MPGTRGVQTLYSKADAIARRGPSHEAEDHSLPGGRRAGGYDHCRDGRRRNSARHRLHARRDGDAQGAGLLDDAARGGVPIALAVSLGVTVRPGADISGVPDPIPFPIVLADHRAGDASLFVYPWCD